MALDRSPKLRCLLVAIFFQRSGTILAISVEGTQGTFLWNYFEIEPLTWEEMSFKGFLFSALAAVCSVEQNHFSNFGRESPKENFCEIILKLHEEEMSFKVVFFLFYFILFFFLLLFFVCVCVFFFNSGGHFVQRSGTVSAILRKPPKEQSYRLVEIRLVVTEQNVILVEDLQRNNPINFGWNSPSSYGGDIIWSKLWTTDDARQTTDSSIGRTTQYYYGHSAITIARYDLTLCSDELKNSVVGGRSTTRQSYRPCKYVRFSLWKSLQVSINI